MKDVLDLELQLFLRSLLPEEDAVLQEMRSYAEEHHIPVVDPEVGHLLHLLTGLIQPQSILEIGTAIGCSTLAMANAMETGSITTIELTEERHTMALGYFKRAGVADRIHAVLGDARELVPQLDRQYDMIFMDAAKGQYQEFLDIADRILKPGGLLVADNVLLNGWVVNLNYPRHRQKTMVYRMKAFLEQFKENTQYQCSVVPLGDGVALIRKHREKSEA
ncbi:MAG: O-methyltransferase [Peptococcaceae bacterium]|nr:O-methyltransferase [Peptococcaceae bacterium]